MDKFSELKAAAMAATPGPWGINRTGNTIVSNQSHPVATVSDAFHRQLAGGGVGKDAEFIAAANPAVILALLAELEDERASREQWQQNCTRAAERIAELEEQSERLKKELHNEGAANAHAYERIRELEKRLATPVRLPVVLMGYQSDDYRIGFMEGVEKSGDEVRAAGFTVEGDE